MSDVLMNAVTGVGTVSFSVFSEHSCDICSSPNNFRRFLSMFDIVNALSKALPSSGRIVER